jgi:hemerythrin-like domain-containing protein/rubredoxin
MEPIGLLMREHRTIEKMVDALRIELSKERAEKTVNFPFLDTAIDFFKTYADRCHHGKEEDILFRDLSKKPLSEEHDKMMNILIQEHIYGRKTVSSLLEARESFARGETSALVKITEALEKLIIFYPKHIATEDKSFFYPSMKYFDEQERQGMLQEFHHFDESLIHERYAEIAEKSLRLMQSKDLSKWRCTVCDYVYDPLKGDPEHGIKPGTPFQDLPSEWTCPVCLAKKDAFKEVK